MSRRSFPLWSLLGVVLVAALVVGSGVLSSAPPSAAQRAASIESVLRCPSCEDLTVADSSAPTAVTVRATIRQMVDQGRTDQQIESYLASRYGSSIVLDPPASGWTLLVWLLPLVGGVVTVGIVVLVVVRRRRAAGTDVDLTTTAGLDGVSLEERKRFLDQSLADADAEYLAGDLSDKDYLTLRRRDMSRLAALAGGGTSVVVGATAAEPPTASSAVIVVDEPLVADPPDPVTVGASPEAPGDPSPAGPARVRTRRSRRNGWFLVGAVAAFGGALILAVTLFASNRLPGQTATGSITLSQSQQIDESLAQAATYQNQGQLTDAAQIYASVLAKHPANEVAMAQLGWLEFETGHQTDSAALISEGRSKLNRAVTLDPGDYAVRLYLGTALLQQDDNAAAAVAQYRDFLADSPPTALVQQAGSELRQAFQQAGQPVPAEVPAS
jgi:cytochrome c-type biogenesis protein CcmH